MHIHKNIRLLAWFNFFVDFKLYAPVAIIYFARVSGSYALGMSIFAIAQLAAAIFEVPTGIYSDIIGRRKTMVLGAVFSIAFVIFYALGLYATLIIGSILEGLSRSFYSGNNEAFLHDTLAETRQEHEYHDYLGRTSSMFQVALAISAALGSIIAHWSFALVIWLSVIPQLFAFFISLKMQEPKVHVEESGNIFAHTKEAVRYFFQNKKLRTLSLANILGFSLGEAAFQFRAAFVNTLWPLWAVGVARMLANLGAAAGYYFSGRIIKRFSELKVLLAGNMYSRAINIFSLVVPTIASPALMSSTSLFYGATQVSKSSLLQKEFVPRQRATMGSLNSLAGSIAFALLSVTLGIFADRLNPAKALLIFQIAMFGVVILYWKLFRNEGRE